MNAPFTDNALAELVERIRAFNHEDAAPSEQQDLLVALKLLAEETTKRWDVLAKVEADLKTRVTQTELRLAMKRVLDVTDEGNRARARYNGTIRVPVDTSDQISPTEMRRFADEIAPVEPRPGFWSRFNVAR